MRLPEGQASTDRFGKDGIGALERMLAHPFTLAFRISAAMEDAREHLSALEPQQFHVLQQIAEIPRAEIKGGAGTGKTVLAIREARRSAEEGRRTLLTCYSKPLANELKRQAGFHEHLTIGSLHEVSINLLRSAGCEMPPSTSTVEVLDRKLPELFLDALSLRPDLRWECVVIDEAQDIFANWWIAIDSAISDQGTLRVFTDTNQRLYAGKALPAADLRIVPIRLLRNLRNTKSIHSAASMHYEGPQIVAEGPDGLPVNWIAANSLSEMVAAAYAEVRRLVYHQDVSPSDIAVLLGDMSMVDAFLVTASRSELEFANCDDLETDSIVVDTIKRFKGLERPAIIIVAGNGTLMMPELAYVGFSRPRFYLSVVAHELETKWLQEGFATSDPDR